MNRALLRKCWLEAQWLLVACAAAIFAFCWVRVWMVSRIDTSRFEAIIDLLPGDWQRFTPVDMKWLVTYAGRISLAYDEPIVVFGMSIWAIGRGSDCVSGELNRGTMEMLLAQPLSRLQILVTQSFVTLTGVFVLAAVAWLGTYTGIQTMTAKEEVAATVTLPITIPGIGSELPVPWREKKTIETPMRLKVDARQFLPATVNLFALGVTLAGLATVVSASDRYRWRTIGIVTGIYVAQILLKLIGMASDSWRWLTWLSFLTAYEPEEFVQWSVSDPAVTWSFTRLDAAGTVVGLGPLGYDFLLIGIGVVSYVLAAIIFQRRDLPAPT